MMKMLKFHITDIPLFKAYMENRLNLAASTVWVYIKCIEKFLITNPDLENLDAYNDFLIKYTIKGRSHHYFAALRAFIDWKISDTTIKTNLKNSLIKPPIRNNIIRERVHLKEDEIMDVINDLKEYKHKILAVIQSLTGTRAGDILNLRQGSISAEEYKGKPAVRLNITGKGQKRNVVFIHDHIAQELIINYITTTPPTYNEFYFIKPGKLKGREGQFNNEWAMKKMNYNWYWMDLKQSLERNGIKREDFATHDFRRCFARRVWEKFNDIHILQSLLNHSDPKVTLRYLEQSGLKNVDYHYEMQT